MACLQAALVRPIKIFAVPIFLILVISSCVVGGYVYLIAASITMVFEQAYGFDEGEAGLTFLGLAIGMASGALVCSFVLDTYTTRMKKRRNGEIKPEWRLPPMTVGFVLSPIGSFIYGWTLQTHMHWVAPIIGTAVVGFSSYLVVIPVTTYLGDAFGIYRASAMDTLAMSRNAISTILPLAAPALYEALDMGWGNSVLAFIALALCPIPLILLRYGERIRKMSQLEIWS